MRRQKKEKKIRAPQLESLKQLNLNAAGIDVGASELYVCVPQDRDREPVRVFSTFTRDLHEIAAWLKNCGINSVAMESTGIYWIPIYEVLEAAGLEVKLANAREAKNLPGRKSDILDCQWIQQLHSYGLLTASFRPPAAIVALRSLVRHRDNLVAARSSHILHMQKALHLMNLQLDNVLSDITGVTGMRILRAIVGGERNLNVLASYRDPNCKNSQEVIRRSLEGHYQPEHLFQLKQALELYDTYTQLLQECDREIEKHYQKLSAQTPAPSRPLPPTRKPRQKKKPRKNEPTLELRGQLYQLAGVDLTAIDGCSSTTIQAVLCETGVDMRPWKTERHFASWLGLSPHHDISGGKVLRSRSQKTKNRANTALRLAAQSLKDSQCWLGAYFRRQRSRLGAAKAITATAHKIARIFYWMLKDRREFKDLGMDYYESQYRQRQIRSLEKKARSLGIRVVLPAA